MTLPLKNKKYLLISHDFSNTGAPKALFNLACCLKNLGAFVIVIGFKKGKLRKEYKRNNIPNFRIPYIILKFNLWISNFFDLVLCNTIVCYKIVNILPPQNKVLWWIHEALFLDEYIEKNLNKDKIINALKKSQHLYCVSEYAKGFLTKYNSNTKVLNLNISDEYEKYKSSRKNDKITIVYLGEITPLKGQDIFIDYFMNLPANIRNKFYIKFIGRLCNEEFYNLLKEKIKNCNNIEFTDHKNHNEAMKELSNGDIFALFSRGDSFSIATAEALMFNKPVLISNNVGIKNIITNENCGYVVKNKEEFLEIFTKNKLKDITSPRKAFLKYFSSENYEKYITKIFSSL